MMELVSNMGDMGAGMPAYCEEGRDSRTRSVLDQAEANYNELCSLRRKIDSILVRLRGDNQAAQACAVAGAEAGAGALLKGVKNTKRELERLNDVVQELDRLV